MTTTEEVTTTEEETTTEEVTTEETTTETTIPERTITIHKIAPAAASATQSEDGIYMIQYDPHDMAGVTFGIYDADGNLVETVITDENGYAESSILNGDYYTVQEMQTVSGYVMNTEPYVIDFTTTEGDTANLEITNDIIRCQIHLSKQLEGDAGDITMVQFGLYTAQDIPLLDGTVVPSDSCIGIANAQEDGTILFEDALPAGNYYVKELATADGYVLSDTIYPVEVIYPEDQTIADITFEVNNGDPIINYQTTTTTTTTEEVIETQPEETTVTTVTEATTTTTSTGTSDVHGGQETKTTTSTTTTTTDDKTTTTTTITTTTTTKNNSSSSSTSKTTTGKTSSSGSSSSSTKTTPKTADDRMLPIVITGGAAFLFAAASKPKRKKNQKV